MNCLNLPFRLQATLKHTFIHWVCTREALTSTANLQLPVGDRWRPWKKPTVTGTTWKLPTQAPANQKIWAKGFVVVDALNSLNALCLSIVTCVLSLSYISDHQKNEEEPKVDLNWRIMFDEFDGEVEREKFLHIALGSALTWASYGQPSAKL